jgi:hypothetical protein
MDHDYIEQFDIVARYLARRLTAEEAEQFEEHFVDCPQCIEHLQTTRDISQGLRLVVAERAATAEGGGEQPPSWFFVRWFSPRTWALTACGLLLGSVLILTVAIVQILRLQHEVAQAKSTAADLSRRHDEDQQSALAAAQERREAEDELRGRIERLEADLQQAQTRRDDQAGTTGTWPQPMVNLPIVVLSADRGPTANEIELPRTPMNFVISLPLEGETRHAAYRVTIFKDQRPLWESRRLRPDRENALTIGFDSRFFQPGEYSLQVEGLPRKAGSGEVANYPFRVRKRP